MELLQYLAKDWSKPLHFASLLPPDATFHNQIDLIREMNSARVWAVTKFLLVAAMSAMESQAKIADGAKQKVLDIVLKSKKDRLYLSKIIKASKDKGLIDGTKEELWDGLIRLRNCFVHNNSISDEELDLKYPNGPVHLVMTAGKSVDAEDFKRYVYLTHWLVHAYAEWCDEFLARAK